MSDMTYSRAQLSTIYVYKYRRENYAPPRRARSASSPFLFDESARLDPVSHFSSSDLVDMIPFRGNAPPADARRAHPLRAGSEAYWC